MRGFLPFAVLAALALVHGCQAVYVQVRDVKISLESAKKLKEIMDGKRRASPRLVVPKGSSSPCDAEELPEDLRSVCKRPDAPGVFERLVLAVQDSDLCEICANAACAGCF